MWIRESQGIVIFEFGSPQIWRLAYVDAPDLEIEEEEVEL